MREVCKKLGLSNRLVEFSNGKKAVDFFQKLLTATGQDDVISDVAILILDINMPVMSGNEAIVKLNAFFEANSIDARPVTCYLSSTREEVMK